MPRRMAIIKKMLWSIRDISNIFGIINMAKYDGLLGQPVLEVEEPDKEEGITFIFKDNRFLFIKAVDGKIETVSIPE
jgi:hypothetical protein